MYKNNQVYNIFENQNENKGKPNSKPKSQNKKNKNICMQDNNLLGFYQKNETKTKIWI